MKHLFLALAGLVLLGTSGCVTQPPVTTPTSYAYEIGDRAVVKLDEIVVSLPFQGAQHPYQNLHLTLGVFINPLRTTPASEYEARGLVARLEPRIAARVSEALMFTGPQQSLGTTLDLRKKAVDEAKAIVDRATKNWKYAGDYTFEVTVLNLYWTDASVGKPGEAPARW